MSSHIVIENYNPQWPILYEEEKGRILDVIGQAVVAIEHVGSTAVPGLGAKPIIDIMVAARHLVSRPPSKARTMSLEEMLPASILSSSRTLL